VTAETRRTVIRRWWLHALHGVQEAIQAPTRHIVSLTAFALRVERCREYEGILVNRLRQAMHKRQRRQKFLRFVPQHEMLFRWVKESCGIQEHKIRSAAHVMRLSRQETLIRQRQRTLELRMTLGDVLYCHSRARIIAIQQERSLKEIQRHHRIQKQWSIFKKLRHRSAGKAEVVEPLQVTVLGLIDTLLKKSKNLGLFPRCVRFYLPVVEGVFLFVMIGYPPQTVAQSSHFRSCADIPLYEVGHVDSL